ncbi:MAG TPA: CD225/dispanin family protein, partial [Longimicrobiaceae bacterium]|nr:CD225/dispanin family protein [Longimicrobiaceae bacterium]
GGYGGGGAPGGGYGAAGSPPQQIPNYLVQAIITTLCCCLPLGIVAIIYATQVNTKRDAGDIAGAWEASKNAKKWATISAVAGVIWIIIIIAFNGLAFLAALAGAGNQ